MAGDEAWNRYLTWSDAVASVAFPLIDEPLPVYLDLEDEVLRAIALEVRCLGDPREGLGTTVRDVTVRGSSFSLDGLMRRQREWSLSRESRRGAPPSLAFLALTVLAAEDMGRAEDDISPIAYYPRLASLLGLPHDSYDVRHQYPQRAEALWGSLNRWLDELDGTRGTPTAYALRHRYVGLPLSQALVREGDRRKLPLFFAQYGLAAGMELAPEVLQRYLDAWFGLESCTASAPLKRLWARDSARERIATVASVELVGWDGTLPEGETSDAPQLQRLGLLAQVRQGFMGSSLDIALTLRQSATDDHEGQMEVESRSDVWLPLTFMPGVANLWRTTHSESVDVASVLEGVVKLRPLGSDSTEPSRHYPRTIVPFVLDEMQSAFLEQERLQLNVDSMLLIRDSGKAGAVSVRVEDILQTCARPGFTVHRTFPGLPSGWVLITDLQLFGAPAVTKYNELVPLARDQLTIAGGMRIPSRVRKWSSVAPPELRASVESQPSLRITLSTLDGEDDTAEELREWTSERGAFVVPLSEIGLGDGDYRVSLFGGNAKSAIQQTTLRLRSADTVDTGWASVARLTYRIWSNDPLGALSAQEDDPESGGLIVDGTLVAGGEQGVVPDKRATATVSWSQERPFSESLVPIQVGSPDPTSCVATGAHHLEYPTFYGGHQPKYIEGTCKYCGLVKRSPGWIRPAWRSRRQVSTVTVEVGDLPPVQGDAHLLWDASLDALMNMGGGGASSMTSVAAQIDGTALFTSGYPRVLEELGHVAIERESDGTPLRWEISPTCLSVRADGAADFIGYWPAALRNAIREQAEAMGGTYQVVRRDGAPSRHSLVGLGPEEVAALANDSVSVAQTASSLMLRVLPRLSSLASALPRMPMPGYTNAQRYDVRSAAWTPTGDVAYPGAYRLRRGFETLDLFRSKEDISMGTAVPASVYLTKYLAANGLGISLMTYLPEKGAVVVPRGCDLPGLYGRALVLAEGEPPQHGALTVAERRRNCLIYPGIPQEDADLLLTLLTS